MPFYPASKFPAPWHHAVCAMLQPGSVILPGNNGRIVALYEKGAERGELERIYERARISLHSNAPSRLACSFVCPTERDAIEFALTEAPKMNQWYLVEPVDRPDEVFVTSQGYWSRPKNPFASLTDVNLAPNAREYWLATEKTNREILFPAPLRVVDCLEGMVARMSRYVDEGRLRRDLHGWILDNEPLVS